MRFVVSLLVCLSLCCAFACAQEQQWGQESVMPDSYGAPMESGLEMGQKQQLEFGLGEKAEWGKKAEFGLERSEKAEFGLGEKAEWGMKPEFGLGEKAEFGLKPELGSYAYGGLGSGMEFGSGYGSMQFGSALSYDASPLSLFTAPAAMKDFRTASPLYAAPLTNTQRIEQPIIQPRLVTQPILQKQTIEQPIVHLHHVSQPVIRHVYTQPIIQPKIIQTTQVQPKLMQQPILQPKILDQTIVQPELQEQFSTKQAIVNAATFEAEKAETLPVETTMLKTKMNAVQYSKLPTVNKKMLGQFSSAMEAQTEVKAPLMRQATELTNAVIMQTLPTVSQPALTKQRMQQQQYGAGWGQQQEQQLF